MKIIRLRSGAMLLGMALCLTSWCDTRGQEQTLAEFLQSHPPDPEGYVHVEGDILIPVEVLLRANRLKASIATAFLECGCGFWGGGDVPYEWDNNVTEANRQRMREAMQVWENVANVRFREKNGGDLIYTHIEASPDSNNSTIGKIDVPFVNKIKIVNWESRFVMVHELGHCLGLWHEQSRPDRDWYIRVNTGNIQEGMGHNFDVHGQSARYGLYDFDSLMHYDACAFSTCGSCAATNETCRTITVLPPYDALWQTTIGQRDHLSVLDELTMSFLYPQPGWFFVNNLHGGSENGTFLQPWRNVPRMSPMPYYPDTTVWIEPGTYSAAGIYTGPMTLKASQGGVVLR